MFILERGGVWDRHCWRWIPSLVRPDEFLLYGLTVHIVAYGTKTYVSLSYLRVRQYMGTCKQSCLAEQDISKSELGHRFKILWSLRIYILVFIINPKYSL